MDVTPALTLKVFAAAAVCAALLDLYLAQAVKRLLPYYRIREVAANNARWSRWLGVLLHDTTRTFLATRTLFAPLGEVFFGAVTLAALFVHGWSGDFLRTELFIGIAFATSLISVLDDRDSAMAPDALTVPGMFLGIVSTVVGSVDLLSGILGAAASAGFFFLVIVGSSIVLGEAGLGRGTMKFGAMIGAFCGWRGAIVAIVVALVLGGLVAVMLLVTRRRSSRDNVAFIPYQAIGGLVALLWGSPIVAWYLTAVSK